MRLFNKALGAAASVILLSGPAFAETVELPTYGHYLGTGVVMVATPQGDGTCPHKVGETYSGQLELDTPGGVTVQKFREVSITSNGPIVVKERFINTGSRKHQVGTEVVEVEEVGSASAQTYKYSATSTPLDLNSFSSLITTELTDSSGKASCTETDDIAFVRSSAD